VVKEVSDLDFCGIRVANGDEDPGSEVSVEESVGSVEGDSFDGNNYIVLVVLIDQLLEVALAIIVGRIQQHSMLFALKNTSIKDSHFYNY